MLAWDEANLPRDIEGLLRLNPEWARLDAAWKVVSLEQIDFKDATAAFAGNAPWDLRPDAAETGPFPADGVGDAGRAASSRRRTRKGCVATSEKGAWSFSMASATACIATRSSCSSISSSASGGSPVS